MDWGWYARPRGNHPGGHALTWTPRDHISIEGVQGRYFHSVYAGVSAGAPQWKAYLEPPLAERGLLYAGLVGQLLTVVYLIKAVLIL